MKENYPENWPQFYTATIQGWKHLLKEEKYKTTMQELRDKAKVEKYLDTKDKK